MTLKPFASFALLLTFILLLCLFSPCNTKPNITPHIKPSNTNTNTDTDTNIDNNKKLLKAPTPNLDVCVPCFPNWTEQLVPTCTHCHHTGLGTTCNDIASNDNCEFRTSGSVSGCVLSSNPNELCTSKLSEGVHIPDFGQLTGFALILYRSCGDELQNCLGDSSCEKNLQEWVVEVAFGHLQQPLNYCDVKQCSHHFEELMDCAEKAAQENCTTDSDCLATGFVCDNSTKKCTPHLECCLDYSDPECCACVVGANSTQDFFQMFCQNGTFADATVLNHNTSSGNETILPPTCLAACGANQNLSDCFDHQGNVHHYGEKWRHRCSQYTCLSNGQVIRSHIPCNTTSNCPEEFMTLLPHTCCPTCYGCEDDNGKWHHVGDRWRVNCTVYRCHSNLKISETDFKCASDGLRCPKALQKVPEGECCPVCEGCLLGANWQSCPCGLTCDTSVTCPEKFQITQTGSCCKICTGCQDKNGTWHHSGDRWLTDNCVLERCHTNGRITHDEPFCFDLGCPKHKQYHPNDQCCPVCKTW